MSVMVDNEPLAVKELGLKTIGEVLSHLQGEDRLVVQMLIDGQEANVGQMNVVRQTCIGDHVLYIETADPRLLALEALNEVSQQLEEAERLKAEAAELLQRNQTAKALEQLGGCVRIWQHAHEAVVKTAELLRVDLTTVEVEGRALAEVLGGFAGQLRQIKSALEQRDFVSLGDVLLYETQQTTENWLAWIRAMRDLMGAAR